MTKIGDFLFWFTLSQVLTLYKYLVITETLKSRQINLVILYARLYFHYSESSNVGLSVGLKTAHLFNFSQLLRVS